MFCHGEEGMILQWNELHCTNVIHPHQRCGYSDSPFARKDTFLNCRLWKWVEGGLGGKGTRIPVCTCTKFVNKEIQINKKEFATAQT